MQALIILCLIAFYLLDLLVGEQVVGSVGWRLLFFPVAVLLGPVLMFAAVGVSNRLLKNAATESRRLSHIAIACWFISGSLLVVGLNWGSIVRFTFQLSALPPLDQVVVLLPLLVSLFLCWAVEFHISRRAANVAPTSIADWKQHCFQFIAIRSKVFLLPALVPLVVVLIAHAVGTWIAAAVDRPLLEPWFVLGILLTSIGIAPWMLSFLWRTQPLRDRMLHHLLTKVTQAHGVRFCDIRYWPTNQQMSNAMVLGVLPHSRRLILTDRLLRLLNPRELALVVTHEIGHVRHGHLVRRIWYVVLPLLALAILQFFGQMNFGNQNQSSISLTSEGGSVVWIVVATIYSAYAFWIMGWISKKMEFQADLFACSSLNADDQGRLNAEATHDFSQSLIKLAVDSEEDIESSGWLHPSILKRIQFLTQAVENPLFAKSFETTFARQKLALTAGIWLVAIAISCT